MGPQGPSGAAGTVGPKVNIHSDNSKHFVVKQGTFFETLILLRDGPLFGGERRAGENWQRDTNVMQGATGVSKLLRTDCMSLWGWDF